MTLSVASSITQSQQTAFKRLLGYVKELKATLAIAVAGNIIYSAMDAWFISLIKPLMDDGIVAGDISYVKMAPLFIIGILTVRGLAGLISTYCMARVGQAVVQKMRLQLLQKFLSLPSAYFDKISSGKLISKVTFNTQQVASASSDALTKVVREGALLIFAVGSLFYINWRLAAIYFVSAPIIALLVSLTSKRFRKVSKNIQNAMGGVTQTTQELVNGFKVVRTYGGQEFENLRFSKIVNQSRQQNLKLLMTKAISVPFIQLIAAIAMSLVVFYAAFEIEKGKLSAGEFVAMFLYMVAIFRPLKTLSNLNSVMQQGLAAAEDIFTTIDHKDEADKGLELLEKAPQKIRFENLSFSYDKKQAPVLKKVSFSVEQGQTIALVGQSGSGKSTITSLLLRLYSPDSGNIYFDDLAIDEFKLSDLRRQIAYVSQQVVLFDDTVAANIAYGVAKIDQQRLILAAEQANAMEFIEKLSDGFNTSIGENGNQLSGGQRQRLAIARAIYKDAPIIILDEATSALDSESERHIQSALEALTQNKTTLVIAHRLSTIEAADSILVMEAGKLVEQGNHAQLLAKKGRYSQLHASQFTAE